MNIKRQIINQIEAAVKERKTLQGLSFLPYDEKFKAALEQESIKTLQDDLKTAQKSLRKLKG